MKQKLVGVQYLRAIAALMVAYFHLTEQIPQYTRYLAAHRWIDTRNFASAVPVFFVISGFVMYISGIESSPREFARKRLARIVPLYWFLTFAIVALALTRPGFLHHTHLSAVHVADSLFFVPYFGGASHEIFPLLGPGWSLNYEMFFYAIFALALFAPLRWRLPTVLLVIGALYGIGAADPAIQSDALGLAYTSGLLLLFGVGLLLGWQYSRGNIALPTGAAAALVVGGFAALLAAGTPAWMQEYVAPTAIVFGVVSLDSAGAMPSWPWLLALGNASYSIYLAHPFAFDLIEKAWKVHANGEVAAVSFAVIALATAIALACGTYRLIELPALRWLNTTRSTASRSPTSVPAAGYTN